MKVNPFSFCTVEITPENDAERLWLANFVTEFSSAFKSTGGSFFEFKSEGNAEEKYLDTLTDTNVPVMVDVIRINPMGF